MFLLPGEPGFGRQTPSRFVLSILDRSVTAWLGIFVVCVCGGGLFCTCVYFLSILLILKSH